MARFSESLSLSLFLLSFFSALFLARRLHAHLRKILDTPHGSLTHRFPVLTAHSAVFSLLLLSVQAASGLHAFFRPQIGVSHEGSSDDAHTWPGLRSQNLVSQ